MAATPRPTHEEIRERLLQRGSPELREEYARLGPRRDAIVALFRARKLRKLTQHELAQRAGVSQGVISRLEGGGHSPKLETLEQIARAMDFRLELKLVDDRESGAAAGGAVALDRSEAPAAETVGAPPSGRQSTLEPPGPYPAMSEHQLRNETAVAYRDLGYEVSVDEELDFLAGFRADLVARKADEVRVIEIRSSSALANAGALDHVARLIEERAGWSFDLVLAADTEQTELRRETNPLNPVHVRRRLDEAEQELGVGRHETAFLLACLALEAKIKLLFDNRERLEERFTESPRMSEQASVQGAISVEEQEQLARLWQLRNAVVHGHYAHEFNEAAVRELIDVVRGLGAAAA